VLPGRYQVTLALRVGTEVTPLAGPQEFTVVADGNEALAEADRKELAEFQREVVRLQRALNGALGTANELTGRLEQMKQAADATPALDAKWRTKARELIRQNRDVLRALRGDAALRGRNENTPTSVAERVGYIVSSQRFAIARPTGTARESYRIASTELGEQLTALRKLVEKDVPELEKALEAAGAPWTPGRLPDWKGK
jgi:hypothetical protein